MVVHTTHNETANLVNECPDTDYGEQEVKSSNLNIFHQKRRQKYFEFVFNESSLVLFDIHVFIGISRKF